MSSTTLQPNDQRRALQECFPQYGNTAAVLKDKKAEATTVRELRAWIEREIHLDLTNAPVDPLDGNLLPKAGACARRTSANTALDLLVGEKILSATVIDMSLREANAPRGERE